MGTIHANSAFDAVLKLQTLPLLAGENISMKFVTPTVASALDLVVHVTLDRNGKRRISEIVRVTGRTEGERVEVESIFKWNGREYEKGFGYQF
jgi:pilus assembly protein CpaF